MFLYFVDILVIAISFVAIINAIKTRQKVALIISIHVITLILCYLNVSLILRGKDFVFYELYNAFGGQNTMWGARIRRFWGPIWLLLIGVSTYLPIILSVVNIIFLIWTRKLKGNSSGNMNKPSSVCPKCGSPISENKKFCTNCGEKINII